MWMGQRGGGRTAVSEVIPKREIEVIFHVGEGEAATPTIIELES